MKVRTDLRAGIAVEDVWQGAQSALTNVANAVSTGAQNVAHKAQEVVNDPGVRKTAGKLAWWPFGPPHL